VIKKMVKCCECGKKLGFLKGYNHPCYGNKYHLCSSCYNTVNDSIERYKEFIAPYIGFFNNKPPKYSIKFNIRGISNHLTENKKVIHNI
jgi:hypothetical protein